MIAKMIDVSGLDALLASATVSVLRIETLPAYDVGAEAERLAAWRDGEARPERSVRTSPYLARVARQTLAGVDCRRIRVVDEPLTDYQRYQMVGYQETQAAGEQVALVQRAAARLNPDDSDVWIIDGRRAVHMHYRPDGTLENLSEDDPTTITRALECAAYLSHYATTLNAFLADHAMTGGR